MVKKFFAILLSFVAACLIVGCGKPANKGNYVATVKIGYYEAGYGTQFMDYWTTEYNKAHPDEQIYFDVDPNVGATVIGPALQNNAGIYDIYLSLATNWYGWARSGWIEPLDDIGDMINPDGVRFDDAYTLDVYRNFGYIDGHRYVLSQTGGSTGNGFVYSEKLFKKHGWKVPETVDELYELVETINNDPVNTDNDPNNDIAPFGWGGQVMVYWDTVVSMWWAQYEGEEYIADFYKNPSPEKYQNREGLKKALQVFENLICTGEGKPKNSMEGAMGKNHLLMQNDFVQYKCAMLSGYYGIINETASYIDPDCDLKVFFPAIEGAKTDENGNPFIINIADSSKCDFMFISKASTVKDYAKKFLVWISGRDCASAYIKYTGGGSPFAYDEEKLGEIPTLLRSVLDMGKQPNFKVVDITTDNAIAKIGKIVMWPAGEPYTAMVNNNKSPAASIRDQYNYVLENWTAWEKLAGLK